MEKIDYKNVQRCGWEEKGGKLEMDYHDYEWGVPLHDDRKLFEMLALETFQAGLSWLLLLKKREAFRQAFDGFEPQMIAVYGPDKIAALMRDSSIVRNQRKIEGLITNAGVFLTIQREWGSFAAYLWSFSEGKTIHNVDDKFRDRSELSDRVSKDFRNRGMKFVGTVTVYSLLQSVGIVNDHRTTCFRYKELGGPGLTIDADKEAVSKTI